LRQPSTGFKYVGQFAENCFHGEGEAIFHDNSIYKGQWQDGQKSGHGQFRSVNGATYVGSWTVGQRHGKGEQEYEGSSIYKGWWSNGMCNGAGVYYLANGSTYSGRWLRGHREGPYMFVGVDGYREKQEYKHGQLVSREVLPPMSDDPVMNRAMMLTIAPTVHQSRRDRDVPVVLPRLETSRHLVVRDAAADAGIDLSAPSLSSKFLASARGGWQTVR